MSNLIRWANTLVWESRRVGEWIQPTNDTVLPPPGPSLHMENYPDFINKAKPLAHEMAFDAIGDAITQQGHRDFYEVDPATGQHLSDKPMHFDPWATDYRDDLRSRYQSPHKG